MLMKKSAIVFDSNPLKLLIRLKSAMIHERTHAMDFCVVIAHEALILTRHENRKTISLLTKLYIISRLITCFASRHSRARLDENEKRSGPAYARFGASPVTRGGDGTMVAAGPGVGNDSGAHQTKDNLQTDRSLSL
jgi:hypothetical protein